MNLPDGEIFFEHAACGLLIADSRGIILKINSTLCAWLGYEKSSLVGKLRVQDLFNMGGKLFHQTHCWPLLQMQGSVAEVQLELIHKDGHRLHTLINIVRSLQEDSFYDQFAIFVATDRKKYEQELLVARKSAEASLTTLKAVQQELQDSRDALGLAMRSAKMGFWTKNLKSNQIWCSRELEELLGLAAEQTLSSYLAFQELIHPDDKEPFLNALDTALVSGTDYAINFRLKHSDGRWIPMEGRGRASNEQGVAQTLFGIVIDVSERQFINAKLSQLNEQLSIADVRKDEFLATLAHELRNPLAPLRNVIELLKLKKTEDPELIWARNLFDRQVGQMTHLVDDLMDISRITQNRLELRMQPLSLAKIMQDAVETATAAMDSFEHNFTVSYPSEPIILNADATRLMQVISNLLTNAAKYTPKGGRILLSARQENGVAILSVKDSGIGIASESLSNVFNMFSQLKPALERSEGGLGIGLALVQGLVALHNGTVSALSAGVGYGSEFLVRLPIPVDLEIGDSAKSSSLTITRSAVKVLVIDDNIDAAESLTNLLELCGYSVNTAHNGLSCFKLAEEFRPDYILLDIGLPDINGYEIARRIRTEIWGQNIFLIAATGWGQSKDRDLAKQAGFDRHLTKPIDFSELEKILLSDV